MIKLTTDEMSALQDLMRPSSSSRISAALQKRLLDLGLVTGSGKDVKVNAKGIAIANPAAMKASSPGRWQSIAQKSERSRK